jgi:tetratricopeptide (TPR) repeat protein
MNTPRVLLIYANPANTPTPVAPYGMERVGGAFAAAGCSVRMSAPYLEADPLEELKAALAWRPDLVGFSVRNVDDTLVVRSTDGDGDVDTDFYLDAVRPLVKAAVDAVGLSRVVLGGTAVGAGPEAVMAYLGAAIAIAGPAEDLCFAVGEALVAGSGAQWPDDPRVVRADRPAPRGRGFASAWTPIPGPTPRMRSYLGLTLARNGRVAVQFSAGCGRRCAFCLEPRLTGHQVFLRPAEEIVAEITALAQAGVRRFWLTASELNVPNDRHAIAVLRALEGKGLDLAGFLQAAPVSDALLDAMEGAGMDPESVNYEFGHLDDRILRAGGGPANRRQIDALLELYLRRGHRRLGGSILLGAHPEERWETVDGALDVAQEMDRALPEGLALAYATGARVYPETPLAGWIRRNRAAAEPDLYGADDPDFAEVVVFSRPASPRALMRHVQSRLQGTKGRMGPMNVEVQSGPAEASVNRALLRLGEGDLQEALSLLLEALQVEPAHAEALRQLALLQANRLGDLHGARDSLRRLVSVLDPEDPRQREIQQAMVQIERAII